MCTFMWNVLCTEHVNKNESAIESALLLDCNFFSLNHSNKELRKDIMCYIRSLIMHKMRRMEVSFNFITGLYCTRWSGHIDSIRNPILTINNFLTVGPTML